MTTTQLNNKIKILPPKLKEEVNDFIDFLLSKTKKEKKKSTSEYGSLKGKIIMKANFDEPLNEFKEYM